MEITITHRVKFAGIDKHINIHYEYNQCVPIPNINDTITGYFKIPSKNYIDGLKTVYATCYVISVVYEYSDNRVDILINSTTNQWS